MRFYSLEKLINLHDDYRKLIKIDQYHFLLIQVDGELYLLESRCPHRGHPLAEAEVGDGKLRCPLHGYEFDLASGAVSRASEELCRHLVTYDLVYEANEVGVLL